MKPVSIYNNHNAEVSFHLQYMLQSLATTID